VQHINDLKQRSQTRAAHRGRKSQQLRQKTFEEYDRLKTISSGRRNQQNESIRTRQMSGQTQSSYRVKLKDDKVKCIIRHVLRNDS